jgi:hypothetical protein
MSKPNKDGWIRHRSGKCPVDKGTLIDVRYRDGTYCTGVKALYSYAWLKVHPSGWDAHPEYWIHDGMPGDIMAWRLHKPDQQIEPEVVANVEKFNAQAEIKEDGPLQWRDRIREINGLLGDLRGEKANLIVRLEKEGFALIDEKPF